MIVLQNDFKSIAYKTVPYKETSLKIGGGSMAVNNYRQTDGGPTFCISDSSGLCGGNYGLMPNNKTGDLRYSSSTSQEEISLQNGAVVKHDRGTSGSVMLAEPRWFYDDTTQTMVINVVCVNSSEFLSKEGIGTVQMELGTPDYEMITSVGGNSISVIYTPDISTGQDYTTAWKTYFENTMKMTCVGSPMKCSTDAYHPVSKLVIKRTEVIINAI
jgi:hypothetical protein